MNVVNMGWSIEADCDRYIVSLEAVQPGLIDQNSVGGHGDRYLTTRPRRYGLAAFGNPMKVFCSPQQRLPTVQDKGKLGEGVFDDMLFETPQQLTQHLGAHEFGFGVNGCVAEPIAVGAVYVTSRRDFNKQLRNGLTSESDRLWIVSRHVDTEMGWEKSHDRSNTLGQTRLCEILRPARHTLCERPRPHILRLGQIRLA